MLRRALPILAFLLAAPAMAAPFHHPFGEWREYNRDWLAACPDQINEDATDFYGYSCFASTGSAEQNSANLPAYKLTLIRNRLTGVLDLAFTAAAEGPGVDQGEALLLRFAGGPRWSLRFDGDLETRFNTINQFFVADPKTSAALIAAMEEGNTVTLDVPLADGTRKTVALSLRGVTGSLDFMETYARRVADY